MAALYSAGIYKGPEITKGLDYLMQFIPAEGVTPRRRLLLLRPLLRRAGDVAGRRRPLARWYPAVRDDLIARQQRRRLVAGGPRETSAAPPWPCIVLQIPNNYLPIFQR